MKSPAFWKLSLLIYGLEQIQGHSVLTLAGSGTAGWLDGVGTTARFSAPRGLTFDSAGNLMVADSLNNRIRKISLSDRVVTTFAGTGFSTTTDGNNASFNEPTGITGPDNQGNLFICEFMGHTIRRINSTGFASTISGTGFEGYANGAGNVSTFNHPWDITLDIVTGNLFVTEWAAAWVRRVTPAGVASTFATLGCSIAGIAIDKSSNLYVAERNNHRVTKISPYAVITPFAGNGIAGYIDGQGPNSSFNTPLEVTVDQIGNLYVGDNLNKRIRQISPTGLVTTIAGGSNSGSTNGLGLDARFYEPGGIAVDTKNGNIYVSDSFSHLIRMIVPCDGGFYVQNATCKTCPGGTFSLFAQFDNSSCIPCGAGNFSAAGSASCSPSCGPGFFTVAGNKGCFPGTATTTIISTTFVTTSAPRLNNSFSNASLLFVTAGSTLINPVSLSPSMQVLPIPSTLTTTDIRKPGLSTPIDSTTFSLSSVSMTERPVAQAISNAFNINVVIYAFAALGVAAVFNVTLLLVYRRFKQRRQKGKPFKAPPFDYEKSGSMQGSTNSFLVQPILAYRPTMGSSHRSTANVLQFKTHFYPQLGQTYPTGGQNGLPHAPASTVAKNSFKNLNFTTNAQFSHLMNVSNPTVFTRAPNQHERSFTKFPAQTLQTTIDPLNPAINSSRHIQMQGITATIVPKETMQFLTYNMNNPMR